jgi:hypothetical protein
MPSFNNQFKKNTTHSAYKCKKIVQRKKRERERGERVGIVEHWPTPSKTGERDRKGKRRREGPPISLPLCNSNKEGRKRRKRRGTDCLFFVCKGVDMEQTPDGFEYQ